MDAAELEPSLDALLEPDSFGVSDVGGTQNDSGVDSQVLNAVPRVSLDIQSALIDGSHSWLADGGLILDQGASLTWQLPDEEYTHGRYSLHMDAVVWRYEDGVVEFATGMETARVIFSGDGDRRWVQGRYPYTSGLPVTMEGDRQTDVFVIEGDNLGPSLRLQTPEGVIIIYGFELSQNEAEESNGTQPSDDSDPLVYESCRAETDCDDGAALSALISAQPDGPVHILLSSPQYHASSPVRVERSHVTIEGAGGESRVEWLWDPSLGSGQRSAFHFQGPGRQGDPELSIAHSVNSGQRRVILSQPLPANTQWVQLRADDLERYHQCASGAGTLNGISVTKVSCLGF